MKERNELWRQNNLEKSLLKDARKRAKQKNLPFDIDETDITIPAVCPVLGIPLEAGTGKKNSTTKFSFIRSYYTRKGIYNRKHSGYIP